MEKRVLDGCGRYSEKLIEISETIIKQKVKNGENPSKNDVWEIDSQIFEAYQTILSNAKDSNIIDKSINYLKETVEASGNINNINSVAISSVEKTILEEQKYAAIKEEASKISETLVSVGTIDIITDIMKDGSLNNLDSFLNIEVVNELDNEIQKVKTGDKKALGGIVAFEGAAEALGKYDKLDEKQTREVLARMMNLAASDSPTNKKLLEEMANKYGFNILEKGEDGISLVDEEKLTELYQSKIPANSKTTLRTIEDFKKVNERKAERAKEKSSYENATQLAGKIKDTAKQKKVRKALNIAIEQENEEAIEDLCEKYPDEVKDILKKRIEAINKAQELGKRISPKIQESILKINSGIKVVKEHGKENGQIEYNNAR